MFRTAAAAAAAATNIVVTIPAITGIIFFLKLICRIEFNGGRTVATSRSAPRWFPSP